MKISVAASLLLATFSTPVLGNSEMTDAATLEENCTRIASGRLGKPIGEVHVELQTPRVDGSIPVNGDIVDTDLTFQCSFDAKGMPIEFWNSQNITGCPGDLSEADRWLFPGC